MLRRYYTLSMIYLLCKIWELHKIAAVHLNQFVMNDESPCQSKTDSKNETIDNKENGRHV